MLLGIDSFLDFQLLFLKILVYFLGNRVALIYFIAFFCISIFRTAYF